MKRLLSVAIAATAVAVVVRAPAAAQRPSVLPAPAAYFPGRFDWQHKTPAEVGMDPAAVAEAVQMAVARENSAARNMSAFLTAGFGR